MDLIRGASPEMMAALSGPFCFLVVLVDVDWPGARVLAHSNTAPIEWGGLMFAPVGKFGAINVPQESMGGVPEEFTMALTCDLPELAEYAEQQIRGRAGAVYLGATRTQGGSDLIGAVDVVSGTCDGSVLRSEVVDQNGDTVILYTLTITFSVGPSYRAMSSIAHSDEDQRRAYPGDTAGRHLIMAHARAQETQWPEP